MRKTPVSDADLQRLTYANMKPGLAVTEVKGPGLHAWSYGTDMTHISAWINFDFREEKANERPGWKAHVSVDIDQIATAWDAILPVVAAHGIKAKVMTAPLAGTLGNPEDSQAGKTIVLYGQDMAPESELPFWTGLLQGVEDALAAGAVRPGWAVQGDFPVPGSAYTGIRHDRDPSGRYSHGIDAFNPYAYAGPIDSITLSPRAVPEPLGTPVARSLRLLGFIHPGWAHDGVGAATETGNSVMAADLYRSLTATGLPAVISGNTVSLNWVDEEAVARSWHAAMEIFRCAELARVIQDRTYGDLETMTVLRRQAADLPPRMRFEVADDGFLHGLHATLAAIPGLGGCTPSIEGGALLLPYAGRYHGPEGLHPYWQAVLVRAVDEAYLAARPAAAP